METPPLALIHFQDADNVTLRGFTISGPYTFPGCSLERHEGILVENALNERIDHNHITMIRNSVPALRGCQEGDAVAIGHRIGICGGIVPGSARVDHNLIDEYQKNGVQVFNADSSAVVDHNEIVGPADTVQPHAASNGVVVLCGAASTVDHNVMRGNHFTGSFTVATSGGVIIAQAPPNTSSVSYNRIFDNDYGIETDTQNSLDISHNDVFQHLTDGIVLCGNPAPAFDCGPATQIVVRSNNVVDNDGSGIVLFDADRTCSRQTTSSATERRPAIRRTGLVSTPDPPATSCSKTTWRTTSPTIVMTTNRRQTRGRTTLGIPRSHLDSAERPRVESHQEDRRSGAQAPLLHAWLEVCSSSGISRRTK